ncbi:unnamed protein product [Arctogadus glacialis]
MSPCLSLSDSPIRTGRLAAGAGPVFEPRAVTHDRMGGRGCMSVCVCVCHQSRLEQWAGWPAPQPRPHCQAGGGEGTTTGVGGRHGPSCVSLRCLFPQRKRHFFWSEPIDAFFLCSLAVAVVLSV